MYLRVYVVKAKPSRIEGIAVSYQPSVARRRSAACCEAAGGLEPSAHVKGI